MARAKIVDDDKLMVPEHFVAGQPHAEWKKLREECPVYWTEPKGFRPYWSVTKYKDIIEVERQPEVFINSPRFVISAADFDDYMQRNYGHINDLLKIIVQMDAPEHTKHRRLLQPWFLPKAIEPRKKQMEEACNFFFDKSRQKGQEGEMDFAEDLAFWFPLRIVCGLLGAPEEDDTKILELAEAVLSFRAPEAGKQTGFEMCLEYCNALAEEKRKHPGDDFATYLVQSKIDDELLGPKELLAHFLTVVTAGHDTTASAITCGTKALLENPDQLKILRDDPSKIHGAADELIRRTSPTVQFARTATRDYVLNGQLIKKGENLCLCFSSANRDEEAFQNANTFNVLRSPNNHLAFGSGSHSCLGSQLARIEIRCFLKIFIERIEQMDMAGPTPWFPANMVTRIQHMPVRYRFRT